MSNKFTPGPWLLETVPTTVGVCHKVGPFPGKNENFGPRHACLYADYPSAGNPNDEELLANARLIAAAPELLNALRELDEAYCRAGGNLTQAECHQDRLRLIAARTAIAKATGEQP